MAFQIALGKCNVFSDSQAAVRAMNAGQEERARMGMGWVVYCCDYGVYKSGSVHWFLMCSCISCYDFHSQGFTTTIKYP